MTEYLTNIMKLIMLLQDGADAVASVLAVPLKSSMAVRSESGPSIDVHSTFFPANTLRIARALVPAISVRCRFQVEEEGAAPVSDDEACDLSAGAAALGAGPLPPFPPSRLPATAASSTPLPPQQVGVLYILYFIVWYE